MRRLTWRGRANKIKDMEEQCWRHPGEWRTRHWMVFRGTKLTRRFAALHPTCIGFVGGQRERGWEKKRGVINKNITIKIELYSRPGIHESWKKWAESWTSSSSRSIQHVSSVSALTREFATTRWSSHHCDLLPFPPRNVALLDREPSLST